MLKFVSTVYNINVLGDGLHSALLEPDGRVLCLTPQYPGGSVPGPQERGYLVETRPEICARCTIPTQKRTINNLAGGERLKVYCQLLIVLLITLR